MGRGKGVRVILFVVGFVLQSCSDVPPQGDYDCIKNIICICLRCDLLVVRKIPCKVEEAAKATRGLLIASCD